MNKGVRPHPKCWANFPKVWKRGEGRDSHHVTHQKDKQIFILSSLALIIKSKILSSSHPQPGPEWPDPAHLASCFHITSHLHPYFLVGLYLRAFATAIPTAWNTLFSWNPYRFSNALKIPAAPLDLILNVASLLPRFR